MMFRSGILALNALHSSSPRRMGLSSLRAIGLREVTVENSLQATPRCFATVCGKADSSQEQFPQNFGAEGGTPIINKDSILGEVDAALGTHRPPDLEVLLTDHVCNVGNPVSRWLHLSLLRFGHIAVRYTTKDGTSRVMNILGGEALGLPGARMVNFVNPAEYMYGVHGFETFSQQGGVYNRPFIGVRIERVSEGAIEALHAYYMALDKRSEIEVEPEGPPLGPHGEAPHPAAEASEAAESALRIQGAGPEVEAAPLAGLKGGAEGGASEAAAGPGQSARADRASRGIATGSEVVAARTQPRGVDDNGGGGGSGGGFASFVFGSSERRRPRMGPGGAGRGAARFGLTNGRLPEVLSLLGWHRASDLAAAAATAFARASGASRKLAGEAAARAGVAPDAAGARVRAASEAAGGELRKAQTLAQGFAERSRDAYARAGEVAGEVRRSTVDFGNCAQVREK